MRLKIYSWWNKDYLGRETHDRPIRGGPGPDDNQEQRDKYNKIALVAKYIELTSTEEEEREARPDPSTNEDEVEITPELEEIVEQLLPEAIALIFRGRGLNWNDVRYRAGVIYIDYENLILDRKITWLRARITARERLEVPSAERDAILEAQRAELAEKEARSEAISATMQASREQIIGEVQAFRERVQMEQMQALINEQASRAQASRAQASRAQVRNNAASEEDPLVLAVGNNAANEAEEPAENKPLPNNNNPRGGRRKNTRRTKKTKKTKKTNRRRGTRK